MLFYSKTSLQYDSRSHFSSKQLKRTSDNSFLYSSVRAYDLNFFLHGSFKEAL